MSIVELSTIAVIFYNPHGGILAVLLKGVKKGKKQKKDNKKDLPKGRSFLKEARKPTGTALR